MKILQLCKKFPVPMLDGETIAITYLAKAMAESGSEVTLLAMNTSKHRVETSEFGPELSHYTDFHAVEIDNRIDPVATLASLFSRKSYHIERFIHPDFEKKLAEILVNSHFDVVQLETLYLAPYIPIIRKYSKAIVSMRAHNVEHEIWQRIAVNSVFPKNWYLRQITPILKEYETRQLNNYDALVAITERDLAYFQKLGFSKTGLVSPIGLDCRDYQPDFSSFDRPLSISFIGSLDWMPNIEGLKWFLEQVWQPILSKKHPQLTLHIAGCNTPDWLANLRLKNVHVHGEVPSAANFINQYSIMVVPLLSGSGMRAKILEGMALGKVVLSTPIGLEGISATDGTEVLIAETPEEFSEKITFCYSNAANLVKTGQLARDFCKNHFDNTTVARLLLETYQRTTQPAHPIFSQR